MKSAWIILTDLLTRAWAVFVNTALTQLQTLLIAASGAFGAMGRQAEAVGLSMAAMNLQWAKLPDALETAQKLAAVDEERRAAPAGARAAAFDARLEFDDLRRQAAAAAEAARNKPLEGAKNVAGAAKVAADSLAGVSSRGTFNALAAGALAGGDKMNDIAENGKKTNKHLKNIEGLLEEGGLDA